MTLATCKKGLNILGKLDIVMGSLAIVCALFFFGFAIYQQVSGNISQDVAPMELVFVGTCFLIGGAYAMAEGFVCLKALADMTMLKVAYIMASAGVVYGCVSLIMSLVSVMGAGAIINGLVTLAFNGLFLYFTAKLRKESAKLAA